MSDIEDQARSLFLTALGRAPDAWPAFLDGACGADAALRGRVEQLLQAHRAMGSIHGGAADTPAATIDDPRPEGPAARVGQYKLLQRIGEGGMGAVFMAEQEQPVKRRGTLTVQDCSITGNEDQTSLAEGGGGVANLGTLALLGTTLSGNNGGQGGGGGFMNGQGTATVNNCTFAGNSAESGGGIAVTGGAVTVTDCTIANNSAADGGGGIAHLSGPTKVSLGNSIVAGNQGGDVFFGQYKSLGYNLIGVGGVQGLTNGVNHDQVGTGANPIEPQLGNLQDNGGPTLTMALLPGSPALGAGNPTQLGVADQRGVVRAGGVNIGAYQASASAFVLAAPASVAAGTPFTVVVTAVDAFGQVAVGYTGTVHFSNSDGTATLPADYTFTAADAGVHTFTKMAILQKKGTQTITVTDIANSALTTTDDLTVS